MKTHGFFAVLIAILFSQAGMALACAPSTEGCGFYSCWENEVHCGSDGYPISFGREDCQKFLDDQRTASSDSLREWYPKVRYCLQRAAARISDHLSCGELLDAAYETHGDCYIETGFCDLSLGDKLEILNIAGGDAWSPRGIGMMTEIEAQCGI